MCLVQRCHMPQVQCRGTRAEDIVVQPHHGAARGVARLGSTVQPRVAQGRPAGRVARGGGVAACVSQLAFAMVMRGSDGVHTKEPVPVVLLDRLQVWPVANSTTWHLHVFVRCVHPVSATICCQVAQRMSIAAVITPGDHSGVDLARAILSNPMHRASDRRVEHQSAVHAR